MSEERKNFEITTEEELKLKNNAPDKMPLNPTQQGWSGQEVRRRLAKVITGNENSVLSLLKDRFILLDDVVDDLNKKIASIEDGTVTSDRAEKDGSGRIIEETYISEMESLVSPDLNKIEILTTLFSGNAEEKQKVLLELNGASQSLAGVMTATDKTRLNTLWSLLQDDQNENIVDTINEILAIFSNYPQGVNIISQFATKADKTSVYTKEETNSLLANYETVAKSSKIYYNQSEPNELTQNDLWFHLVD